MFKQVYVQQPLQLKFFKGEAMKKKFLALVTATAMVLSLAACGGSSTNATAAAGSETEASDEKGGEGSTASTGEVYELSLASMYNDPDNLPDFNGFGWGIKKFIELVEERSDGRIKIKPYWAGVMGGDLELFNQLVDGELDIYYGSPTANIDPIYAAKSIPYLFKDYDQVKELYASPDAPLFKLIHDRTSELGAEMVAAGTGTFRDLMNSKHVVKTPEDCKDLTLRSYEDYIVNSFWSGICNATVLPYSECYTAFQTKTCDGGEFANTIMVQQKYYEVCKYVTDIHWQWVGHTIMFNNDIWAELPEDLQEVCRQAAWDAFDYEYGIEQEDEANAYAELEANGMEVYHLTDDERQQWVDYARTTYPYIAEQLGEDTFKSIMEAAGIDY